VFLLILSGCKERLHQPISTLSQKERIALMDSLSKLDSLVIKNRTTNNANARRYGEYARIIGYKLNTPEALSKTFNMIGNAFSISHMDSGFYYYSRALQIADSNQIPKEKAKVLYNLAMLNIAAYNYKSSIILLDSAMNIARSVHDFIIVSNSLNSLGNIYLDLQDDTNAHKFFDSAFQVAKMNSLFQQMGTSIGSLAKFERDSIKAIGLNKSAIRYLRMGNGSEEAIAFILINIGNCFAIQDSSIFYYKLALHSITWENTPEAAIGAYNNLACSYLDKGDINNAENCILNYAIPYALKKNNFDWQSTVYETYSEILRKEGKFRTPYLA